MQFFKGIGLGMAWGLGIAAVIGAAILFLDLVGCFFTCGDYSCFTPGACCSGEFLGLYEGQENAGMGYTAALILIGGGGAIGAIYGAVKQAQEGERLNRLRAEEAAKRNQTQRQKNAQDFAHKHKMTVGQCVLNKGEGDRIKLAPSYNIIGMQEKIWTALNEVSIPLQELEDIVLETLSMKGDV